MLLSGGSSEEEGPQFSSFCGPLDGSGWGQGGGADREVDQLSIFGG